MNLRVVVASCAALVLAAGGVTWWVLGDDPDRSGAEPTERRVGEDAGGSPTSPSPTASPEPAGAPVAACASAQGAGGVPRAYWGMHVMSPIGDGFPEVPITAVNLTTSGVYWNVVETAPGQYDFSRLDDIVATAEDRRAQPMVVLGFTPTFHSEKPNSATPAATMPDEAAWRAWVSAVADRYRDRLDYQVWPEPNIVSNWAGTPAQMAG